MPLCPPWPGSALLSPRSSSDGIRGLSARPALPSARCSLQTATPGLLHGHCAVTPGCGHPCPDPSPSLGRARPWQVAWIWACMRGTWGLHMVSP